MKRAYDVPENSSELCLQIAAAQREIVEKYNPRTDYMLYIGIPFCASRCAYCSFPSDAHNKAEKYAAQYIDALLKEIYYIAGFMENAEMRLKAIYIGGGTPTALAAPELRKLLDGVSDAFGGENPDEYTVEAGRAETMDCDKLNVIRNSARIAKRLRLCVNPQTMNARTLELVGRSHTPEDVVKAYRLARESGFDDINMDIIAGLPGETAADFKNTLDAVFNLGPDSVTSHTLCIKRSSRINEYRERYMCPEAAVTEAMQEDARRRAAGAGMSPYYLYRQKNTAGGLANVGYAIKGRECVYNVHEMADRIDILAAGAGAVSKFVYPGESRVERVFNVKNLLEYISRSDEMTRRKTAFLAAACERRR
jgi:oxygen-independent coproporphyrinogen-3 oxidase